ncbi:DUF4307 domain-containing protein [Tessaracoccus sp. OS52]|uniref:DUF4307 domain-containing protein n=1 Tax=Tessaracoccus sp. OS52 TaxID=2886691 RepID=UPI001D12C993|nr:DUF4307 domain-containing protein [Tessaracoccus sp. OS52]
MTKPELTDADRARIAARYPKRNAVDLVVGIAAAVALLMGVGLVAVSGFIRSNPPVAGMIRAFDTISPEVTSVEIVVQRRDPSQAASCFLFAQAETYERVGEMDVEVPPGTKELTEVFVDIRTIREAASVSLENCHLVD